MKSTNFDFTIDAYLDIYDVITVPVFVAIDNTTFNFVFDSFDFLEVSRFISDNFPLSSVRISDNAFSLYKQKNESSEFYDF